MDEVGADLCGVDAVGGQGFECCADDGVGGGIGRGEGRARVVGAAAAIVEVDDRSSGGIVELVLGEVLTCSFVGGLWPCGVRLCGVGLECPVVGLPEQVDQLVRKCVEAGRIGQQRLCGAGERGVGVVDAHDGVEHDRFRPCQSPRLELGEGVR